LGLIGLEINDAGIVCAEPEGRLRPTEAAAAESPGFALAREGTLMFGLAARRLARVHPRQTLCGFWDDLSDQPLRSPEFAGYTHAELAYRHLGQVWSGVGTGATAVILTVPDHYGDRALGLLLGIAATLDIPVHGLMPQALACLAPDTREGVVLHLDVQLHRLTLTAIDGRERPRVHGHTSITDAGLERLYRQWIKILADAFVRQTRFDPLYAAETEQALYDRLPALARQAPADARLHTLLEADGRRHRIELDRSALTTPYAPWIANLSRQMARWQQELGVAPGDARLMVTHRVADLPGFVPQLEEAAGLHARHLAAGTSAAGALPYARFFENARDTGGVPFLNRVPGSTAAAGAPAQASAASADPPHPTHLVYRGLAYAISAAPLVVGREPPGEGRHIRIRGSLAGISRRHFNVVRQDGRTLIKDTSRYGTCVDETPVTGPTALRVGQTIRIGTPGETLQVIACIEHDETTTA
jgi:hypothetical protein